MARKSPLAERLEEIRGRIATACEKAKRSPSEVTLVAVTKTAAPEQIREILQLGVTDLGESRVQVLQQRAPQINEFFHRRQPIGDTAPPKLRWHMIGHLQRNKIKAVLPLVAMVHSVDSLRLAEDLDEHSRRVNRVLPVLLQVNASEESQKHGVAVGAALHLAEQIATMPNLQLMGLMAMAPHGGSEKQVRAIFSRTRELLEEMQWHKISGPSLKHLSMGMSDDFEWAIAEGATIVRVGSSLFGHEESGLESADKA